MTWKLTQSVALQSKKDVKRTLNETNARQEDVSRRLSVETRRRDKTRRPIGTKEGGARERERKRGWRRKKLPVNIPRLPESTKARLIQSGIVPTLRESAWNTPSYRAAPPIAFPLPFIRPLVIIHWNRTADAETQFKSATLSSLGFGTKEEWIRL